MQIDQELHPQASCSTSHIPYFGTSLVIANQSTLLLFLLAAPNTLVCVVSASVESLIMTFAIISWQVMYHPWQVLRLRRWEQQHQMA